MTIEPSPDAAPPTATSGDLTCLVYLSSATCLFDREDLLSLAAYAARKNQGRDITGMLCYFDGSFLQVLEGPREAVEAALATIRCDPRHLGLVEMYRRAVPGRVFGDWSMALIRADERAEDVQARLRDLRRFTWNDLPEASHRGDLEALLETFRAWLR